MRFDCLCDSILLTPAATSDGTGNGLNKTYNTTFTTAKEQRYWLMLLAARLDQSAVTISVRAFLQRDIVCLTMHLLHKLSET